MIHDENVKVDWPWRPFVKAEMPKKSFKMLVVLKDGNIREAEWLETQTAFYCAKFIDWYIPWDEIPRPSQITHTRYGYG